VLFVSLRDLQWRRRRFIIGVIATGLVFALALLISGISGSFHNEIGRAVGAFHVDEWVVPNDVSGPFTSTHVFPATDTKLVAARPGVHRAEPVALFRTTVYTGKVHDLNLIGIEPGGIVAPKIREGRELRRSGDLVVDKSLGLKLGAHVTIANRVYTVVGRTTGLTYFAGTPVAFMPLSDLQLAVLNGAPLATAIVVTGSISSPPNGYHVLSNSRVESDLRRPMQKPTQTIDFVKILLWIVAAGIVGSVLYLQAIERSRDFAVFKATGVSAASLLWGLIVQAIVLAITAALAAYVLAFALKPAMSMTVEIPTSAYVTLPIVAIGVGLLSSVVALRRALSVDPALAFGG
jgi:putative ABC transport system permease protein